MSREQDLCRPAAFLDRDGTINVECHYLSDPAELELLPGVTEGLHRLQKAGYALVLITNQSGIARGYFDHAQLDAIHARLKALLAEEGICLDGLYACPHGPDDQCSCRKPLPGLALQAKADLHLDLKRSIMIGDKSADIGVGKAIGATTILVRTGHGAEEEKKLSLTPDYVADDLAQAAVWACENL